MNLRSHTVPSGRMFKPISTCNSIPILNRIPQLTLVSLSKPILNAPPIHSAISNLTSQLTSQPPSQPQTQLPAHNQPANIQQPNPSYHPKPTLPETLLHRFKPPIDRYIPQEIQISHYTYLPTSLPTNLPTHQQTDKPTPRMRVGIEILPELLCGG